jgi:TctA family transporter
MVLIGWLNHGGDRPDYRNRKIYIRYLRTKPGIDLVPVAMGLFGIAEVLCAARESEEIPKLSLSE